MLWRCGRRRRRCNVPGTANSHAGAPKNGSWGKRPKQGKYAPGSAFMLGAAGPWRRSVPAGSHLQPMGQPPPSAIPPGTTPIRSDSHRGPAKAGRQWHSPPTHAPRPPHPAAQVALAVRFVPLGRPAGPPAARAAADRSQKRPAQPASHTQAGAEALGHAPRPEQL